ncbi:hypothetical protein D3C73_1421700 [compost metagenome]
MAERYGTALIEISIGRRVGNYIAHMHTRRFQLRLTVTEQRVALDHLGAAGMPDNHHILHIGKLPAITEPGNDLIQRSEGAQCERCGG